MVNPAVKVWLDLIANCRQHGETHERPLDRYDAERQKTQPLPLNAFNVGIIHPVLAFNRFRVAFDAKERARNNVRIWHLGFGSKRRSTSPIPGVVIFSSPLSVLQSQKLEIRATIPALLLNQNEQIRTKSERQIRTLFRARS